MPFSPWRACWMRRDAHACPSLLIVCVFHVCVPPSPPAGSARGRPSSRDPERARGGRAVRVLFVPSRSLRHRVQERRGEGARACFCDSRTRSLCLTFDPLLSLSRFGIINTRPWKLRWSTMCVRSAILILPRPSLSSWLLSFSPLSTQSPFSLISPPPITHLSPSLSPRLCISSHSSLPLSCLPFPSLPRLLLSAQVSAVVSVAFVPDHALLISADAMGCCALWGVRPGLYRCVSPHSPSIPSP